MWEILDVLKRHHRGESQRRIAAATGRGRKTIRAYIRVLPAAVCGRRGTKLWPPGGSRFWRPRANGRSVQSTSSDAALWQAEHGHRYC